MALLAEVIDPLRRPEINGHLLGLFIPDEPLPGPNEAYNLAPSLENYWRLPEQEVYGRSLSSIYRLGNYAVAHSLKEAIQSPEADQVRAEFRTSVEEGFGTDIELGGALAVRDFDSLPVIDGKVMSRDRKTSVSDMTYAGLIRAEKKVSVDGDREFEPQLTRSSWDHENALIVDKMARGETGYNTRIVVSPYVEEAAAKSGDEYWRNIGYVPHLKRGFVQLYFATKDGNLITASLSFDGSNKERLRGIFARRGVDIPETEITDNWLKYAITDNLTEEEATELALEIANEAEDPKYEKRTNTVDVYNRHSDIIEAAFNESYVHACKSLAIGHQTPGIRSLILQLANKAYHFNAKYSNALYELRANASRFTDEDMAIVHDMLVYSTIEMIRSFYLSNSSHTNTSANNIPESRLLGSLPPELLYVALSDYAVTGAINLRVYSACGLSISLGESAWNPQAAFSGNVDHGPMAWAGGKTHEGTCVNCHKSKTVGVENWCESCIKTHCGS